MTSFSCTRHSSKHPWTYRILDEHQRHIAARVREGGPGEILLSEVAPVITTGRRTPGADLFPGACEVYPADRGGLATWHGPGQWVLFPVDSLERLTGDPRGVRKAVCLLLEIACDVAREYDRSAEIREGAELGVWTSRGKVASVGIHVEGGVLLHGLSLNGFRTETSFQGLRPCGLDLPIDFILREPSEREFLELGQKMIQRTLEVYSSREA